VPETLAWVAVGAARDSLQVFCEEQHAEEVDQETS
jgi:hypothetical protein